MSDMDRLWQKLAEIRELVGKLSIVLNKNEEPEQVESASGDVTGPSVVEEKSDNVV